MTTLTGWLRIPHLMSPLHYERTRQSSEQNNSPVLVSVQRVVVLVLTTVPSQAARRIVLMYAGIIAPHIIPLGRFTLSQGSITTVHHLFLARDLGLHKISAHIERQRAMKLLERALVWQQVLRGYQDDGALQLGLLTATVHRLI